MDDKRRGFRYSVCGFGPHIERRTVEFMQKLDDEQVCNWCGVVSGNSRINAICRHMVCEDCFEAANNAAVPVCCIDKQTLKAGNATIEFESVVRSVKVRCANVDRGCDYTESISELDRHLRESCAFYLKECSKCENVMPYKNFISHFRMCEGVEAVILRATDAQSLLEDVGNARKELEQALASTSSDVRDAVGLVTEQFERLRSQLTASSEGAVDDVTNDCNQ